MFSKKKVLINSSNWKQEKLESMFSFALRENAERTGHGGSCLLPKSSRGKVIMQAGDQSGLSIASFKLAKAT